MNNSEKRFVLRLMSALAVIQHNANVHRDCWEQERKRCNKDNEEFVMDKFLLGRSTLIRNQVQKLGEQLDKQCSGELEINRSIMSKTIDSIYDTITKENSKNQGTVAIDVEQYKQDNNLPKLFIDSWLCVYFGFKYILNELSKTVEKYNVDLSAVEVAINQYNKFFEKEILVVNQ